MAFICSIAGLRVRIDNRFPRLERQCRDYIVGGGLPVDIDISLTDAELAEERARATDGNYGDGYIESLAVYRRICSEAPRFDAFLLHGSVIDCAGRGIAFLAPSGVGKTTHTLLWKNEYPSDVTVINGDKPIVRFIDGAPYAFGTPWAGKERLQTNSRVLLSELCFIERGKENRCEEMAPGEAAIRLLGQIYIPREADAAGGAMTLADRLLKSCRAYRVICNTDPQVAREAHAAVFGGEK